MKELSFINSSITPKDAWDALSLKDKAEMMKVAVRNGITDLKTIREKYNEFAEGGDTVGEFVNAIYENNPREEYLGEPAHHYDFTQSEDWADTHGYYPNARGHRDDRVKKPAHPSHPSRSTWDGNKFILSDFGMETPNYTLFGLNDGGQDPQATLIYDNGVVLPEFTITPGGNYIENTYDNIRLHYAKGGKIYIKPENRGKFTALKERTGHSATWFKEHGTPAQRKMATFALNARHWKHGEGGPLQGPIVDMAMANMYDGESEKTQQMQIARPDATYVARSLVAPSLSKKHYDWEDAAINRAYQVFSNYDDAKDETMPWAITKMRNAARWVKDNIYDGFPSGVSNCTLTTTQWVDPNNPIAHAKSIHKNPERYNYTKVDSTEILPGNVLITRNPNNNSYHTMLITGFAGQDSTAIFDGMAYPVKKGEPLLTYSRGGHDNSFIRRNIPLSAYTPNSDGKTENLFYRYNYPREVFLPEVIVKPKRKKK